MNASAPAEASTSSIAAVVPCDDRGWHRRHRRERAGRLGRRAIVAVLAGFVVCGLFGMWGSRQATLHVTRAGYRIDLTHPAVTRGGLPAGWSLTVARLDGAPIDEPITIATTAGYLAAFDRNAITPEPDAQAQSGEVTRWQFAPGDDAEFRASLDIRTQPDARWRHSATTTVSVGAHEVARLEYSTWVLP